MVERLGDVPVEQALDVVAARRDLEELDVLGNLDFGPELTERDAELRERLECLPRILRRESLEQAADVVVGELPDRSLLPVHVEEEAPAGRQESGKPVDRVTRRVGVVENALREDDVD